MRKVLALAVAGRGYCRRLASASDFRSLQSLVERAPASEITPTTNTEQQSAPVDADESERPMQDVFHEGLVAEGYPEGLAGLISSDLEVVSNNSTHQHYIQTLGGGGTRELIISLHHVNDYTSPQTGEPIVLEDGTHFYVIGEQCHGVGRLL